MSTVDTRSMEESLWEKTKERCTWKCVWCKSFGPRQCQFYRSTEGHDLKQRLRDPIIHEFHPHPLQHQYGFFFCNACYGHFFGDSYSCRRCNFDLDVICASGLPGRPEDESGLELHFSHHHLLTLVASDNEEFRRGQNYCQICGQLPPLGGDTTLGCKKCKFYIHGSCREALPRQIGRPYHKCTLFLVTLPRSGCDRCHSGVPPGLWFYCGLCDYRLCLACSLLCPADLSKSKGAEDDENVRCFRHFFHNHDLIQIEKPVRIYHCYICGRDKSGPVYACLECPEFLVHVSCANYPPVVKSYFHLAHSLNLRPKQPNRTVKVLHEGDPRTRRCNQCCKICYGAYECPKQKCYGFSLDHECASLVPVISYKWHQHLLSLMKSMYVEGLKCSACRKPLDNYLPVFRCGPCNFNLHLQCGPLPSTINTKYHVHHLQLLDYFVEDDRDDFCCHVCEKTRDPLLCVYCCPDCGFVAHLKCLLSEIILLLEGKGGHVYLKTVGSQVPSELVDENLVMKQIKQNNTNQHLGVENEGTGYLRFCDDVMSMSTSKESNIDFLKRLVANHSIFRITSKEAYTFDYSEEEFKRLIHELESLNDLCKEDIAVTSFPGELQHYVERYKKSVIVLDQYLVPDNLVPIFNDFLDKYGDISIHSQVDPLVKSVLLCWVCALLEDLSTTKVVDVTESKIKLWWSSLIFLKKFGFDTDFILDHVKQLVQAYFGVRAQHYIDSKTNEFEGTIHDCSDEIERLERQMEKAKAKREEARKQLKDHQAFLRSATTSFIKQSIKEGRRLKWRYAATGLLNVNGGPSSERSRG